MFRILALLLGLALGSPAWAYTPNVKNVVNALDFGADPTGTVDSTTALTNAGSTAVSNDRPLYIPGGTYKLNSNVAISVPSGTNSLTIIGDGPDVTVLKSPNANDGLTITLGNVFGSFHIQDMSFVTCQAGGGNGVTVNQSAVTSSANGPRSNFKNVTFRDCNGYALGGVNYWTKDIKINGVSYVDFDNIYAQGPWTSGGYVTLGTCFSLEGGTSTLVPVIFNFRSVNCNATGTGINVGAYVQGVTVDAASNFVGGHDGILVASALTGIDEINVNGAQFNMNEAAVAIKSNTSHAVSNVIVSGALILVPSGATGILSTGGIAGGTFTGNTIQALSGASGTGISIVSDVTGNYGVISANNINNLATGISLGSGSLGWNVGPNNFTANTTDVTNTGSSVLGTDLPWITYTPAVVCGGGGPPTTSANSGSYQRVGSVVRFSINLTISALNACTTPISLGLPVAAAVQSAGSGYDVNLGVNSAVPVFIAGGGAAMEVTPAAHQYVVSGVYPITP